METTVAIIMTAAIVAKMIRFCDIYFENGLPFFVVPASKSSCVFFLSFLEVLFFFSDYWAQTEG